MAKEKEEKIIQPIFSRHPDINKIAFMNWRMGSGRDILNVLNIADGFLSSAILLATSCAKRNKGKRADILIFPILTNANHGIELYLKGIMWTLNKLINSTDRILGSHNIDQIFRTVRSKIEEFGGTDELENFDEAMLGLSTYINELYLKINATAKEDKMDFSRYPFNSKYKNHFYINEFGNIEIDLVNFVKRFKLISKNLEMYSDYLYHGCLNASD